MTSRATLAPMALVAVYTASKLAIEGFTASLAHELEAFACLFFRHHRKLAGGGARSSFERLTLRGRIETNAKFCDFSLTFLAKPRYAHGYDPEGGGNVRKLSIVLVSLGVLFLLPGCSGMDEGTPTPAATGAERMASEGMVPGSMVPEGMLSEGSGTEQTVAPALPSTANPTAPPAAAPMAALQPALPVLANENHELLLSSAVPELAANKRLVYDMWRTLIEARDTAAAEQYLAEGYIQHNPNADTGRAGVLAFFSSLGAPLAVQPRVQTPLVAIVAERDYVALVQVDEHDLPRPYTTTWFDLFRIEGGRIAEHWDHGRLPAGGAPRAYVPPAPSSDQEAALASLDPQLATNKRFVYDMWRTLLDAQQVEEAPKFLADGYVQHNPQANTGLQGFLSFFRQFAQPRAVQPTVTNFIQELGEGDLVVLATVRTYDDAAAGSYTTTWFDMFRLGGGLLVEHWDTATLPE